jgi:hypothetical protein
MAHLEPKLSPDGQIVAFRGPSRIGSVPSTGGTEGLLVSGANLGDFLWAPTSTGIYFLDGVVLKFVSRQGGNPVTISTLTGAQHRLWAVNNNDTRLFGTRFNATTGNYHVFSVPTNGSSAAVDVVTNVLFLDGVRLDPTNAKMLYRAYVPQPFTPREYFKCNLDGSNNQSVTNGSLNGQLEDGDWIDAGQTIAFNLQSTVSNRTHLALIGGAFANPSFLTEGTRIHRRSVVTADRKWILCEGQNSSSGAVPTLLPVRGGGLVPLVFGKSYQFNSPPTIDAQGTRVAWTGIDPLVGGFQQVFSIDLDRELEIGPRIEIGQNFQAAIPVQQNEAGGILLSAGLLPAAIPLPPFRHEVVIDPSTLIIVVTGVGTGSGPITVTVPVPNDPSMQGASLYWQGVRLLGMLGEFTRHAETRVF